MVVTSKVPDQVVRAHTDLQTTARTTARVKQETHDKFQSSRQSLYV